jgi:hypothetical protein
MADTVLEEPERIDPFEIFSPQIRESVRGLAYVGNLEKTVKFCGHSFTLRTLRPAEKAAIATAVQPWRNTLIESVIWANAHVGLALVAVDDDDAFCPQTGPELSSFARARLNFLTNSETGWYQPTLDFLYTTYLGLENEVLQAIDELQSLADRSQQSSSPSADSLTDQGTSADETSSAIPSAEPSS